MPNEDDAPAASTFADLGLDGPRVEALAALGFDTPTPIQQAAIPLLLEGRDIIGRARTGSGKTAAFALPLVHGLQDRKPPVRAIVLAPTRELARQVAHALGDFAKGTRLRYALVYGGVSYDPQIRSLETAQVLVGTPGRTRDLVERGALDLSHVETFVLDEADEMLRLGFLEDVDFLLAQTPESRQVALFSATMPNAIRKIAAEHLTDPLEVQVEERALSVDHIPQVWLKVHRRHRLDALERMLRGRSHDAVLVFAPTRATCAQVADGLAERGFRADAIHGDLNQGARERVLKRFKARQIDVLVGTDVAARGLDVDHITHVVQLGLPPDTETYVHRIGRTARSGRDGLAIAFVEPKQIRVVRHLQKALGVDIEEIGLPSDDAIRERLDQELVAELKTLLVELDDPTRERIAALVKLADLPPEGLATAALAKLLTSGRMRMPASQRGLPRAHRDDHGDTNEVELFFPVGRTHGVRPGDFVGALANELGVDSARIGRVNIFDYKSFVGLPKEVADAVLEKAKSIEIRGHEVPLALGWGKPSSEGAGRPTRPKGRRGPPRRGPPRGRPGKGPHRKGPRGPRPKKNKT